MNFENVKQIYPELANRRYSMNPNAVQGTSIINKYLAPINIPENLHPFAYIFKNALIEIARLSNYNIKTDFMTQLSLILYACTEKQGRNSVKIVLFKSPIPGDINYDSNRVFNVVKRENYFSDSQYMQWLDFDEICVAYFNSTPYFITRVFLQSVMNLRNNQTFEDYFNKIGIKYQKEKTYNTGIAFFNNISRSMNDFIMDKPDGRLAKCIYLLNNSAILPLLTTDKLEVSLLKNNNYYLKVTQYMFIGNTNKYGVSGLLSDLIINNSRTTYIEIDPITANTLIAYFYQDEDRFIEEGTDFLYHMLAYYPQMTEKDLLQREITARNS